MRPVVARGRKLLATIGSVVLGAGLAVTLAPAPGTAVSAAPTADPQAVERPAPASAPRSPAAKALADALPARLGAAQFTSVYGATGTTSSTRKKLMVALSASKSQGNNPSFYIALSRGQKEQHAWGFQGPKSSFDISRKGAGKLTLTPKKTAQMGKVVLRVKPDGKMKSQKCAGKVYAKTRNVIISGTFFFDTGSKWGKVGNKKQKNFKFKTTHQVYFSYDVNCPPQPFEDPCYEALSWSHSSADFSSFIYANKPKGASKATIYASRWTMLPKPKGAWRSDTVWGTAEAPVLTENEADNSATMKIYGVRGSGTITAPPDSGFTWDDPCDTGTQHVRSWGGTVTNGATPLKVPAQVFGSFTVPNGSDAYMSRAWSN